ncbi:flagellar type III secretion system protein FlhB [Buchnera aphidicola (Macrosiphoniella sanborni)]|uniref:Flagellar biosynthetic protein FlhB n=1 Tax=Buchnera aphidicola (Macrosiphoniella sanborni) TaxID=1241865 RepID=A0A4D6Y408_9GAMM|nr:flagellar biosynthesis protein FlhB [Buchnera aphidicola]QCI23789.1 flagellar type III secretion system protein FlhB [Buchnera aphidicola (Macrosiphoniella sanborni)]
MNHNIHEEKTENPTEHHIKKIQKKGKTKYSRELNSFLILLVGFLNVWWFRDVIVFNFSRIIIDSFNFNRDTLFNYNILLKIFLSLEKIFFIFLLFFISLLIVILIPQVIFSGIKFNIKSLKFDLKKLHPGSGLKRIFSSQTFREFLKVLLKLFLVIIISLWYLWLSFSKILFLIYQNYLSAVLDGFNIIGTCYFLIILGVIPMVIFDILWQEFNYYKTLKMTRGEIKEESKEQEGHPNIKMRIRREMKAVIRRRMIKNIPKADVIITNPIHYSVALQYDEKKMNAPKVIAKGVGEMAIKIKNIALKHNISIISSPLLARSLYRYSEIGQYIPGALYKAVAEVLAWVWKVRKWKKEGGVFPEKPNNILIPSELNMTGDYNNHD